MTDNDIIELKIATLSQNSDATAGGINSTFMTENVQAYLSNRPELVKELEFIESFWSEDMETDVKPSAQMDANFYQMLSRAQAVKASEQQSIEVVEQSPGVLALLKSVFTPQPIMQFAALSFVFVLGFNLNQPLLNKENQAVSSLANLQQEVSSLNTMLAISLLDKSSASERLSGVSYSRSSDSENPLLQEKLMGLIQYDKSTSVRLAVINRLHDMTTISAFTEQLLQQTINEDNVLVKIALCRLLVNKGGSETTSRLKALLPTNDLNPEIREILQAKAARSFI